MTFIVFKDVAIQIFVCYYVKRNVWLTSLTYHFFGWGYCMPLLGAVVIWTLMSLVNNAIILEMSPQSDLYNWYRLSANFLFFAFSYILINIFPVTFIFLDERRSQ